MNGVLIRRAVLSEQKTLEDYLRRTAILDRDARGGAMALLLATELAAD